MDARTAAGRVTGFIGSFERTFRQYLLLDKKIKPLQRHRIQAEAKRVYSKVCEICNLYKDNPGILSQRDADDIDDMLKRYREVLGQLQRQHADETMVLLHQPEDTKSKDPCENLQAITQELESLWNEYAASPL